MVDLLRGHLSTRSMFRYCGTKEGLNIRLKLRKHRYILPAPFGGLPKEALDPNIVLNAWPQALYVAHRWYQTVWIEVPNV